MTMNTKAFIALISQLMLTCTLVFSSTSSLAGIYKWVDENGVVHYGQQRPKNAASKTMNVQRNAPVNASTYKRPGQTTDGKQNTANKTNDTAETNPEEGAKPKKKKETKTEKKRRLAACAQARNNLTTMQAIGRIRSKDKDGNTNYLSQKQKDAKMKKTRDIIAKYCK